MQPPLLFVIAALCALACSGKAVPQFGYEEVHGYEKDPVSQQYDAIDQYERIKQDIIKPFHLSASQTDKDAQQPAAIPQAEGKEKPVHPVEAEIEAKDKPVNSQAKPQGDAKSNYHDYEPEFDERKDTYGVYKDQADLEFNIKDTISNLAFKKLSPVYQELDKLAKWEGDEKVDDGEEEQEADDKGGDYEANDRSYGGRSNANAEGYGAQRSTGYGSRNENEGYGARSSDYGFAGYGASEGNKRDSRDEGYENHGDYSAQFEKETRNANRYA